MSEANTGDESDSAIEWMQIAQRRANKMAELRETIERLEAEIATFRAAQKACEDCDALTIREHKELKDLFDLRWQADRRAVRMWRDKNPGNDLVIPDHAGLVVWLLEELDKEGGYVATAAVKNEASTYTAKSEGTDGCASGEVIEPTPAERECIGLNRNCTLEGDLV